MLSKYRENTGNQGMSTEDLPTFRRLFWTEIIDKTVHMILGQIACARRIREKSGLLRGSSFLEYELERLERATNHALEERDTMIVFLAAYTKDALIQ